MEALAYQGKNCWENVEDEMRGCNMHFSALYCIELDCIVLYWIELYCIVF
jgi:hypothetical protein